MGTGCTGLRHDFTSLAYVGGTCYIGILCRVLLACTPGEVQKHEEAVVGLRHRVCTQHTLDGTLGSASSTKCKTAAEKVSLHPGPAMTLHEKHVLLPSARKPMPARPGTEHSDVLSVELGNNPHTQDLEASASLVPSQGECQEQVSSSSAPPSLSGFPYACLVMKSGYLILVNVWKTFAPKFLMKYETRSVLGFTSTLKISLCLSNLVSTAAKF